MINIVDIDVRQTRENRGKKVVEVEHLYVAWSGGDGAVHCSHFNPSMFKKHGVAARALDGWDAGHILREILV